MKGEDRYKTQAQIALENLSGNCTPEQYLDLGNVIEYITKLDEVVDKAGIRHLVRREDGEESH